MTPFSTAFTRAVRFGLLTAVHLPDDPSPVSDAVLDRLPPDEQALARTLRGYKQVSFVGGRLALHQALGQLRMPTDPVLTGPQGQPLLPEGVAGSITHKRTLAVALVASSRHGDLGVDLEDLAPEREGIAQKVLRPEELAEIQALPPERRWTSTVLRFSLKEAVYKVLNPHLNRYIGFHEARVVLDLDLSAHIELHLDPTEDQPTPPDHDFSLDGRYLWMGDKVLTMVRLRPDMHSGRPLNGPKGKLKGAT
ncbi:MAG: 4'-phosphopantetheinyl transferase superfamily protein [Myxococcota bacterium]|nr:4'-phosphopantetheinyl transferase superfamily protein [Myxococcota bacterium]